MQIYEPLLYWDEYVSFVAKFSSAACKTQKHESSSIARVFANKSLARAILINAEAA